MTRHSAKRHADTPGRLGVMAGALRLGWDASKGGLLTQLGLALVAGAIPTATATLAKLLVDTLVRATHGDTVPASAIMLLAAGGAALAGLGSVVSYLATLAAAVMGRDVNLTVADRLYGRINAFRGLRPFEDPDTQDTVRLAEQSAQQAPRQVLDFLLTAVRSAVTVLGLLGAALATWPPLGALLLITVAVSAYGQFRLGKRSAETTRSVMASVRRQFFFRMLLTDRRAAMELRLFGIGPLFHRHALDGLRRSAEADLTVARRTAWVQSVLAVLTAAVAAVAAVVIADRVAAGTVTIGGMTLFGTAVASIQGALTNVLTQLGRTEESLRLFGHYLALLRLPADLVDGTLSVQPLRSGIVFEDVWFRYSPDGPWVLRGLDLTLPNGEAVGLVGANGAGKSTLIKLLCRFYDPDRGRILWDGVDIREFSLTQLRRRIGVTFQDYMTYDMSARDNIGVGAPELMTELEPIRQAAQRADIDHTLAQLPRGYDTLLSRTFLDSDQERGVLLSGGQWQRVALARSVLRQDADLLILDEPSSGLDPLAERRVHSTLVQHRSGRTCLLVSHRLSTLRDADRIVVLADGHVAEHGTHDQLLALGGTYTELFTAQAEGYQLRTAASAR